VSTPPEVLSSLSAVVAPMAADYLQVVKQASRGADQRAATCRRVTEQQQRRDYASFLQSATARSVSAASRASFLPTCPTLSYKENRAPPKIRALPSGTLSQTLDLETFATTRRSSQRVVSLVRHRWTLSVMNWLSIVASIVNLVLSTTVRFITLN